MLTLRLEVPIGPQYTSVGPEEYFKIDGDSLMTPCGEVLAVYHNGAWDRNDTRYTSIFADNPTRITGDGAGGTFELGPYTKTRLVDGSIWTTNDGVASLLGRLNEQTKSWQVYSPPHQGVMVLTIHAADTSTPSDDA